MKNLLISLFLLVAITFAAPAFSLNPPGDFAKSGISVGLVVENLNKSLDFYQNVVGMVKTSEFSVESARAKELGLSNGDRFDVTILKLENSDQAAEWKLMSFGKKPAHPRQKFVPDDTGMQYITLYVKSMKPILERIKKYNVKTLGITPTKLDENRDFVLIQDPDGNFIELIGPK
ncbi:MAG TPA: VOC family protein [Prolixibacteraceae bacterium]|nr:VOC family protein [Prolixibacteraceae bacterium]HPR84677.1 VOC family protein [Prolixibacteraceae bacterium]